ncbi:MAG: hypothetical protein JWM28_1710 [Chitinophagaceae bacterium]|nr:hypothetical protein [Chitinophagaceae bacterium]
MKPNDKYMNRPLLFLLLIFFCNKDVQSQKNPKQNNDWHIAALPSSVRIDPATLEIIDTRYKDVRPDKHAAADLLRKNWIYDGNLVNLSGARGEYVSFQVVIFTDKNKEPDLKDIKVRLAPFKKDNIQLAVNPELFLEWSVKINTISTGYTKASLGNGWYPDALIPFSDIQIDTATIKGRWVYPLWLPDFNNRIEGQKATILWIDQYIPFDRNKAEPGIYQTTVSVSVDNKTESIPVNLQVWNFALPNENKFKASLQEEGFLSEMPEKQELEIYQLFKRNRVGLMDPTYKPELIEEPGKKTEIKWKQFDARLNKYFTGEAFTKKYGYTEGPGYGEPVETFVLPFDVYGKYGTAGWPDIGKPGVEKNAKNQEVYVNTIKTVRDHLKSSINPSKTDLIVYLNGLDESYFQEAFDRMIFYGNLFRKHYPEASFRIDGAYTTEQMNYLYKSITAWGTHTINYNHDELKKFQESGIKNWLYGPMIYEGKVNSWVGSVTFTDLPLINQRALSWACVKYNIYSWLSWGIGVNWQRAWYDPEIWKDEYKNGADSDPEFKYKKLNGNGLLIYSAGVIPNVNSACPSIRLKAMRDGVQEYEYLQLIKKLDGNAARANEIVNSLVHFPFGDKSIGNINVWEYDAEKWDNARIQIGNMINKAIDK